MFYAYILRSEKDGTFYYGSAKDVRKRVRDHNAGRVKYTRGYCPYVLHYS
ncbi:MAG: nuclease superfamily protein [Bacteroidetes bacterium]|nr:nuclease superfamily protein [Bacteroidota bacterium]